MISKGKNRFLHCMTRGTFLESSMEQFGSCGCKLHPSIRSSRMTSESRTCWICLGNSEQPDIESPLVSEFQGQSIWVRGCTCSIGWAHQTCLLQWIDARHEDEINCPQCKRPFRLTEDPLPRLFLQAGKFGVFFPLSVVCISGTLAATSSLLVGYGVLASAALTDQPVSSVFQDLWSHPQRNAYLLGSFGVPWAMYATHSTSGSFLLFRGALAVSSIVHTSRPLQTVAALSLACVGWNITRDVIDKKFFSDPRYDPSQAWVSFREIRLFLLKLTCALSLPFVAGRLARLLFGPRGNGDIYVRLMKTCGSGLGVKIFADVMWLGYKLAFRRSLIGRRVVSIE